MLAPRLPRLPRHLRRQITTLPRRPPPLHRPPQPRSAPPTPQPPSFRTPLLFLGAITSMTALYLVATTQPPHSLDSPSHTPTGSRHIPHFPTTLALPSGTHLLLGTGTRTVTFLSVEVYVAGAYVHQSDLHLLPALRRSAIRIVPSRDTNAAHLRDGWVRAVRSRAPEADVEGLRKVVGGRGKVAKGTEVVLARSGGTLEVWGAGELWGRVEEDGVVEALWNAYLQGGGVEGGKGPAKVVSEGLKKSVEVGIERYLRDGPAGLPR